MSRSSSIQLTAWKSSPSWMEPYVLSRHGTTIQRSSFIRPCYREVTDIRHTFQRTDMDKAEGPFPQNKGPDRLIPGNVKPVFMECFEPFTFLPRKRRVLPKITDNRIMDFDYQGTNTPMNFGPGGRTRDTSSITGKDYTRRKFVNGPGGHLVVEEFDGGVPGEAPLPSRWYKY